MKKHLKKVISYILLFTFFVGILPQTYIWEKISVSPVVVKADQTPKTYDGRTCEFFPKEGEATLYIRSRKGCWNCETILKLISDEKWINEDWVKVIVNLSGFNSDEEFSDYVSNFSDRIYFFNGANNLDIGSEYSVSDNDVYATLTPYIKVYSNSSKKPVWHTSGFHSANSLYGALLMAAGKDYPISNRNYYRDSN